MTAADYKLLSTEETTVPLLVSRTGDWKLYPGDMRNKPPEPGAPQGSMFVKTGGNALQAVSKHALEQDTVISVVVPEGKDPGDILLVACPYTEGRLVSVTIPENTTAGSAFLVQAPPSIPMVVTGVPVETARSIETPVVYGCDFIPAAAEDELALREETSGSRASTIHIQTGQGLKEGRDFDEKEYEMVCKHGLV